MDQSLTELAAANVTFVGSHFAMSHPLRAPMIRIVGERSFPIIYSLVSLTAFAWIYFAFTSAPSADLGGSGQIGWIITTLIMLPAMILFSGSFIGNPALPTPDAGRQAIKKPTGVFKVTRHPMMWSFALWALSHIILMYSWRTLITALAMGFLAVVGAALQDEKKRVAMGKSWAEWQSKTAFAPKFRAFFSIGAIWWVAGILLWLIFSWAHLQISGIPAGIWRWICGDLAGVCQFF